MVMRYTTEGSPWANTNLFLSNQRNWDIKIVSLTDSYKLLAAYGLELNAYSLKKGLS